MNFELSGEQKEIRTLAREFARKEIAPIAAQLDETGEFPRETIKRMGELGFLGLDKPEEYGGQGGDYYTSLVLAEELVHAPPSALRAARDQ